MSTQDVKYKELISKSLNDLKNDSSVVFWTDFVITLKDEIIRDYYLDESNYNKRKFKGDWIKRVKSVADELKITIDMKNDNWFVIEKFIEKKKTETETEQYTSEPSSGSKSKASTTSESKKSILGYRLNNIEKEDRQKMFMRLDKSRMWKLSSNRNVEEIMEEFTQNLNYEHPACSLILDINDEHWLDYFSSEEIQEIKQSTRTENSKLPENMRNYLDGIPKTTDIKEIFLYLNSQIIDPFKERNVYWLKTTLQQAADLFVTSYLPITDQTERDIIRQVWGFIDTAYDSELTFRSEKSSFSCMIENNKRRKIAATNTMDRQRSGEIPDMLILYDRYEFGAAEVSKNEADNTKELNDGSIKLAKIMKSMLLNLTKYSPSLQNQIKIVGMFFSGLKVGFLELSNPSGHICVLEKRKEMYFPVHPKEFYKRMIPLVEQVWINKMEMEARLEAVLVSDSRNEKLVLPPCFQKQK